MREWALEVQTKDGQRLDWRRIDWTRTDIRDYDVIQENGPKSVMGKVKFTFPNPHTIFMHDTLERDKYMFNASRRTFSHGCMRVRDPLGLAQILLREMFHRGPSNNEIPLTQWVPVHVTYFTAMVDEDGKLRTYPDVYGHEKRITMALEGKWDRIVKGRDHLAPVELDLASAGSRRRTADAGESWGATDDLPTKPRRGRKGTASQSSFGTLFGGF
jgi:murein L,D-transpeptidase YcbB/YkuD